MSARPLTAPRDAPIPLFATRPALEPLLPQIAERQRAVLESGRYILGPEVEAFEAEFAAYHRRRHCVGVANGTEALTIALRALGVGPGDEVVVPAFSFFATAEAVVNAGARPVLRRYRPGHPLHHRGQVEPGSPSAPEPIVPVHLFGNPAPMRRADRARQLARPAACSRTPRRPPAHDSAAPCRRARRRGRRSASTRGRTSAPSATPARSSPTMTRWPRQRAGSATTGQRDRLGARGGRLQLAAGRAPGGRAEGPAAGARRVDRRAATRPAHTSEPESATWSMSSGRPRVRPRPSTSTWSGHAARDALSDALRQAGVETRAYYTTPLIRQPALVDGRRLSPCRTPSARVRGPRPADGPVARRSGGQPGR